MNMDAITLAAVADEWRALLTGARIDTIIQPTEHAIAIQCYAPGNQGQGGQNRWLYLSTHPQLARAHITALKPAKIASEPPPFVMLLRKHLEGARIEKVQQPRWERVIELIVSYRGSAETEERFRYSLIVEIMGRLSNIILCDEQNMILGSIKHIGSDINRYRIIEANVQYVPPPPQTYVLGEKTLPRLEPTTVTAAQLAIFTGQEEISAPGEKNARKHSREALKLWQLLTRYVLGFSPLLAREAVYRTMEDTETPVEQAGDIWEELAWNVRELGKLYDTHSWRPQLVERIKTSETGKADRPAFLAYTPYPLEQFAELQDIRIRQFPSINVLLDEYYAGSEWRDAMETVRAPIRKALLTQRDRCKRKANLLEKELGASAEAATYRFQAELLLAYQNDVQQGQSSVTLQNFFESENGSSEVTIPLDPRLDGVGNANRLFNKYHKLRRALALIPAQIEQNKAELATIEQLLADLTLADTPGEVALVKAEVQAAGYMRGGARAKEKKSAKSKRGKPVPAGGGVPLHVQSSDGFTLLIGKNSRQNETVTFQQATASDIWLHARGVPGAHVIIKAGGREIPRTTIEQAAKLAAYYSQARGSTSVPVDYTFQRYVRHMKGGGPGMVIYERERTIYAEPLSFS